MAHSSDDLPALLAKQRAAFLSDGLPSAALRRDRIDRLIALLTENVDEFCEALTADFGSRPAFVNQVSEAAGILPDVLLTRARLEKWMRTTKVRGSGLSGLPTVVERRPLGVVGVMGPWNFPIALVAQPAAAAFAAGNRVMAKISDVTPRTADAFATRARDYFEVEEFCVVTGGLDVGVAFSKLPFDHLFFTGSPQVGAIIAQEAAKNLVPVTLELGGKNPAVVGHDADLRRAARRIMAGRLTNGGQLCLCPDDVFVPRQQLAEFVELALTEARRIAPTVIDNRDLVSIVNDRNYDRVVGLIDDARAKGARIHEAAPRGERLPDRTRRRIAPTIITGVSDDMDIAHDEVFGPVLSVHPYDKIEQVVERCATRPTPLAAYWFGDTDADFDLFRAGVASGGITVNDFAAHNAVLGAPFGGLGRSGTGAYHGRTGFETFSHRRAVVRTRLPVSLGRMMTPPYSPVAKRILRATIDRAGAKARSRSSLHNTH